jgi:hypothetical protein
LLNHVANPPRSRTDKNTKRQRLYIRARDLIPDELVPDLRSIPMHDAQPPAIARELDNRRETLARMPELVGNRRAFARR